MYDLCMSCAHVQCRLYNCMCARFLSFTSLDSTGLSTSLSRHTLLHGGSGHSGVTRLPWRREALQFEETVAPSERALAADFAQPLPSRSPPRSRSVSAAQLNGRSGSGVLNVFESRQA